MGTYTKSFFKKGNDRKVKNKAKPKCIALAGKPLNIPKLNIKGNGEANHSWNNVQAIAIEKNKGGSPNSCCWS